MIEILNYIFGAVLMLLLFHFAVRMTHPQLVIDQRNYVHFLWGLSTHREIVEKPLYYETYKRKNMVMSFAIFIGFFTSIWYVFLSMLLVRTVFAFVQREDRWIIRLEYLSLCGLIAYAGIHFIHGI